MAKSRAVTERVPPPTDARPMLATLAARPPAGPGWAWELKWDGIRALSLVEKGSVRLWTRNGNEVTPRYPELQPLGAALDGHSAFLDGEIVTFDARSRPSFERLQRRMHVKDAREIERLVREVPVVYVVFDLLWHDGHLITALPYEDRRRLLTTLVSDGAAWRVPSHEVGDGHATVEVSKQFALEGVVAKRLDSTYEPGRRSSAWLKVKNHVRQEFVVGGWAPGNGARSTSFGALLLGYYDESGALRYAGRVGTGFTEAALDDIQRELLPIERDSSPFANPLESRASERDVHFVEPRLVAEVRFTEWTSVGRIRHPSFLGLRTDKPATEVTREG
ncbi:MAG: non-homologous end-joining DNA ligase [Acidimicrobiia bacterium]